MTYSEPLLLTSGKTMSWSRRFTELLLLLSLAGCAGTSSQMAPVERPGGGDYVVRKGDNLYGIAFQRGVTVQDIVNWNAIANPDLIHPGQRLRMSAPTAQAGVTVTPVVHRPVVVVSEPKPASRPAPAAPAVAAAPAARAAKPEPLAVPPTVASTTPAATAPAKAVAKPAVKPPAARSPSTAASAGAQDLRTRSRDGVRWTWPSEGRIIKGYSASSEGKKGINIAGREGQAVVAAASGKIVYAGSGLGGYGKLIIVEHNKKYLSAYAHNSVLKAKEGDRVTIGETIAAMGKTGTSRVMLHFEIRRDGKSVDPVRYLPTQSP